MDRQEQDARYNDMQQFTLAISHELKNSITRIKLALSLVENEEMPGNVAKYVQLIHRASVRLENTMQSLTEIIQMPLMSEVAPLVSPADILNEVLEECAESISSVGARIETNVNDIGEMRYVRTYLKIIFTNVIGNAIKYADPSRALHLVISARRIDGYVEFIFADNGIGIDLQKNGQRLFKPFTRLQPAIEGSGLGLYVIKGFVERNGGHVEVESNPGKGSSFRFLLKEYIQEK